MRKFIGTILGLALMLPFSVGAQSTSLNLTPTTLNQGGSTSFSGSCGTAGANGTVTISTGTGSSVQTTTVTSNASGEFSGSLSLPANFPTGSGVVTATCPNGSTTFTGNLTVDAQNQAVSLSPMVVNQGGTLTVSGSCAGAGAVNISVGSGSSAQSFSTTANSSGSFNTNITLPSTLQTGSIPVVATCPNGSITSSTNLTVNALNSTGTNINLVGNAVIGQGLSITGVCGTTPAGGTVNLNLVQGNNTVSLGTATTTGTGGNFSGTFTIPSNLSGGAVTITANCPNGIVTLNTNLINSSTLLSSSTTTPSVGGSFTVNGVCGTTAGGNVSIVLSNSNSQVVLGSTTTGANGSFSTVVSVPNGFPTGNALLVATCPGGTVSMRNVSVTSSTNGGTVNLDDDSDVGGVSDDEDSPKGGVSDDEDSPKGGVAAGTGSMNMLLGLTLLSLGVAGVIGSRLQRKYNDDTASGL